MPTLLMSMPKLCEFYGILQRSLTRKPKGLGVITKRWPRSGTFSSEAATLLTVKLVI